LVYSPEKRFPEMRRIVSNIIFLTYFNYIYIIKFMNKVFVFLLFFISVGIYPRESLSVESNYLDVYFEEKEEGGYIFYGDNSHFVPIFVNLGFTSLSNLDMDVENPAKVVIPPGSKGVKILELTPKRDDLGYSFRSRLTHGFGDPFNTEADNWIYVFPYAHGTKYRVDQGYGGTFSHRGENYYSLDFPMDEGSGVYAARGGVVIDVKKDSSIGGPTQQYGDYGNYITIYHLDGTYASYVHLVQNGSLVEVGEIVEEGTLIGYSGNTGLSTGPHLHFSVSKTNLDGKRESIPVKFLDHLAMEVEPQVGEYYYANHRGKDPFEYFFGKDLALIPILKTTLKL
jgi:murein DD-endopeptidase MepM/ murein hydrolase activator NlpD